MVKTKTKADSKQKTQLDELLPKEVQRKEETYRKDLKLFKSGLIAGERFKKDGINKLAQDLEKAGTVELHKISTRIKQDLEPVIDGGYLEIGYISRVLDEKYKREHKEYETRQENNGKMENSISQTTQTTGQPAQGQSTLDQQKPESSGASNATQTTESSAKSLQSQQEQSDQQELVSSLYSYIDTLSTLMTGFPAAKLQRYINNRESVIADSKDYRSTMIARFFDLDAETLFTKTKTLSIILDDFLKQLDNNLDVRKKKQPLTSE